MCTDYFHCCRNIFENTNIIPCRKQTRYFSVSKYEGPVSLAKKKKKLPRKFSYLLIFVVINVCCKSNRKLRIFFRNFIIAFCYLPKILHNHLSWPTRTIRNISLPFWFKRYFFEGPKQNIIENFKNISETIDKLSLAIFQAIHRTIWRTCSTLYNKCYIWHLL